MIEIPSLVELMEAGVHFGHKKERSFPKARKYIYILKDQIYVIDLEKTREGLKEALKYLENLAKEGKTVLFVGTKRQARDIVEKVAKKYDLPYINHRWLGGTLTNFETIRRRLKYLDELLETQKSESYEKLKKKEKARIQDEINKLHQVFDGIRNMKQLPDALFVVDIVGEKIAVEEARKIGIPVVAMVDTNANPELVNYPIPANDDAVKSIDLIVNLAGKAAMPTKTDKQPEAVQGKAEETEAK